MMDVQQITSQLAGLPDAALQKYAMMHKDDPYIMALAISESRRRKQMRTAAVPQVPPQPKVAEQALMEMAPASGVDALPTQGMDFASGGIVAFADGGDVERYQSGGVPYETPYDRMNRENREAQERADAERIAAILASGNTSGAVSYGTQMEQLGQFLNPVRAFRRLVSDPTLEAPASAGSKAVSEVPAGGPQLPRGIAGARDYTGSTPPVERGLGATPEAAAIRKPAGPGSSIGAPSVVGAKKTAGEFLDTNALKGDLKAYLDEEKAAIDAARSRREEGKPGGKAYSKFEESLQAEEAGAGKEKDDAKAVAIFKAGLAMMAGTSPRAFENIGKGAMVGLDEYTGAMKDMKKSAKERQKALADIEQARRAEERDDWKAARDFEAKAEERMAKARETGVKGIMEITGKSAEIAAGIYKTQVTEQGALQRTNIAAAASVARGTGAGERQTLAELKALQTSIQNQLKDPRMLGPKGDPLRAQLAEINARVAAMAGLGTMTGAPGAQSPGGTLTGWGKAQVIK